MNLVTQRMEVPETIDTIEAIQPDLDLFDEIERLKKKLNAVVLAHYYQEPDIQDISDVLGDSLQLAREAQKTDADVIVFAGVHFMAETAKILNPNKKVLLPDLEAGCSLAESCPAPLFRQFKARHPDAIVVSYINCTAEIKALTDIICTSSNAEDIIRQIPKDQKIIFAPDKNLGAYLMKKTGRELILWPGSCIVHEIFNEKKLVGLKVRYPQAEVIAHPECQESILRHADFVGSTKKMLGYSSTSVTKQFIVATEPGLIHEMQKNSPEKLFIPAPINDGCACNECPHMRLNTLEKLYLCMKNQAPELTMPESLRLAALKPIERMLEMSK